MVKSKRWKIFGWSATFSILSLIALIVFILAIKSLLMVTFSEHALWIALVSGVLLAIFIITGTLQIKTIVKKGKGIFG